MDDGWCATEAPDEKYFRFMDSLIPGRDILSCRYDPFAVFPLDPARHGDYIVEHMPQWGLVIEPGNHVVSGQMGVGKTTFCRNLEYSPPDDILIAHVSPMIADLDRGRFLHSNRHSLLKAIAAAFWRQIARVPDLFAVRNPDPAWQRLLCWCFCRFPPQADGYHKVPEALKQECCDEDTYRSGDCLRDIIRLVTESRTPLSSNRNLRRLMVFLFTAEELKMCCADLGVNPETISKHDENLESFAREIIGYFDRRGRKADLIALLRKERPNANWVYVEQPQVNWKRAFDHIRLLIESPQDITPDLQCQLIKEATRLTLSYQRLFVTVFIGRRNWSAVQGLRTDWPHCPEISRLPPWTAEDLRILLWRRLRSLDFPRDSSPPDDPLPKLAGVLSKKAAREFIDTVVEYANSAEQDTEAAPVHALRLARKLLAECAQRQPGQPKLGPGDLRELCNSYWNERKNTE